MTTGRINQVTILTPEARRPARTRGAHPGLIPRRRDRSSQHRKGQDRSHRPISGEHAPAKGAAPRDHPIAPTEFPEARSAPELDGFPLRNDRETAACAPQEEDAGGRSRPGSTPDGYQLRLTPRNLVKTLAKGQSSTDLIIPERTGLSDFSYRRPIARGQVLGHRLNRNVNRLFGLWQATRQA